MSISPAAIFSPSVARQQFAAAKDWKYIDNWLSSKFGKSLPPFERNSETLQALLALATLNETADEAQVLLARSEAKAVQDCQSELRANPNHDFLLDLKESLTREGHTSLDVLSASSVALGQPIADIEKMARQMLSLQATSFDLEQASERVAILERSLSAEFERIRMLMEELQGEEFLPTVDISAQTTDYQKRSKVLAAKLPELRDRVNALAGALDTSKITVQDVRQEEKKLGEMMKVVKDLEASLKAYHSLPQDTDSARLELEHLQIELRDLIRLRDTMFEGLVERESPLKRRS